MRTVSGKAIFMLVLLCVGVLVALAVYQVPQPWRGVLVGWLFLSVTLGTLVLRLIKHHYEYKALQLQSKPSIHQKPQPPPRARFDNLDVIRVKDGGGRYTVR